MRSHDLYHFSVRLAQRKLIAADSDFHRVAQRCYLADIHICILGNASGIDPKNPKIHYFEEEVDLVRYIGERAEKGGLILLEIPLPEIIDSYIW